MFTYVGATANHVRRHLRSSNRHQKRMPIRRWITLQAPHRLTPTIFAVSSTCCVCSCDIHCLWNLIPRFHTFSKPDYWTNQFGFEKWVREYHPHKPTPTNIPIRKLILHRTAHEHDATTQRHRCCWTSLLWWLVDDRCWNNCRCRTLLVRQVHNAVRIMPDRSVVSSNLIQTITELRTAKSTQKSANTSRNEFAFALTQMRQAAKCHFAYEMRDRYEVAWLPIWGGSVLVR